MSFLNISQYLLWYPPSISGYEKVKIITTTATTTMETDVLTKGIVIFGATGDLCKKKLIPALYKLWQKELLPDNFLITGCSRRDPGASIWKESLGDYPDEFLHHLDYISADLDMLILFLISLIIFTIILTSYLFLQKGMLTRLSILKRRVNSMTPIGPAWLSRNPLGTIINLLIIYSLWLSDIYAKSKYIACLLYTSDAADE